MKICVSHFDVYENKTLKYYCCKVRNKLLRLYTLSNLNVITKAVFSLEKYIYMGSLNCIIKICLRTNLPEMKFYFELLFQLYVLLGYLGGISSVDTQHDFWEFAGIGYCTLVGVSQSGSLYSCTVSTVSLSDKPTYVVLQEKWYVQLIFLDTQSC